MNCDSAATVLCERPVARGAARDAHAWADAHLRFFGSLARNPHNCGSPSMLRLLLVLSLVAPVAAGCQPTRPPELRVLGVHSAPASQVFVQVTNPASRPLRLTRLEYTFASAKSGTTLSHGEVALAREIPAGAAVVVEVPLDAESSEPLTLRGRLTAELDQIVRTFKLAADIQPQ